jgi:hypothetical protein
LERSYRREPRIKPHPDFLKTKIPSITYPDGTEPEWLEKGTTEYPSKEAQIEGSIRFMKEKGFVYVGNGFWRGKGNKIGVVYDEGNPNPVRFEE